MYKFDVLIIITSTTLLSGCLSLPGGDSAYPTIRGTWVGQLTTVQVQDRLGRTFEGTAIQIHDGLLMDADVVPEQGAGKIPLLVFEKDTPSYGLIPSSGAAVGEIISVSGKMTIYGVSHAVDNTDFAVSRYVRDGFVPNEHIIILRDRNDLLKGSK